MHQPPEQEQDDTKADRVLSDPSPLVEEEDKTRKSDQFVKQQFFFEEPGRNDIAGSYCEQAIGDTGFPDYIGCAGHVRFAVMILLK
jgi:hypothetical protein